MVRNKSGRRYLGSVPVDVWINILSYLPKPIPAPLSRPERTKLRQPDLCAAARTCREFRDICNPLLYENVVIDDLYLFLFSSPSPDWRTEPAQDSDEPDQLPQIPQSLLLNLKSTKFLHIEYLQKTSVTNYDELIGKGGDYWATVGLPSETEQIKWAKFRECQQEAFGIGKCVMRLQEARMEEVLPSLESISVASIYGYEADGYAMVEAEYLASGKTIEGMKAISMMFQNFLGSGSLQTFSQRDTKGPLSIVLAQGRQPNSKPFSTYIHFGSEIGDLPLIYNQPTHWVYDGAPTDTWDPLIRALGKRLVDFMIPFYPSLGGRTFSADDLQLTIHCSTSLYNRHWRINFNAFSSLLTSTPHPLSTSTPVTLSSFLQNAMVSELDIAMRRILAIPETAAGAAHASWVTSD